MKNLILTMGLAAAVISGTAALPAQAENSSAAYICYGNSSEGNDLNEIRPVVIDDRETRTRLEELLKECESNLEILVQGGCLNWDDNKIIVVYPPVSGEDCPEPPTVEEEKPEETKPEPPVTEESKPEETQPAPPTTEESKPEETEPAPPTTEESKLEETEPTPPTTEESKPEETQPAPPTTEESKPEETQPVPPATEENSEVHPYVLRIVELVNEERAKAGLNPLVLDESASRAAQTRAKETVTSFSHTRPDGRSFATALTEEGIQYRRAGENIAWGQRTPEQVMEGWMNSSGHRANILGESFTHIGVGYYQVNGINYWTQLFYQ